MKRWLLTILVYLLSQAVTAGLGFFLALFLVGPHGGVLPNVVHMPVGIVLWICVIAIPLWISFQVHRKYK